MSERKAVFISGAASGIGLAAAKKFAREGWLVGIADIDEAGAKAAVAALGNGAGLAYKLDVRDEAQWKTTLEDFVKQSGGRLDALVNNAGLATYNWFEDQTLAEHMLQIDVNITGVVLGAYTALPYLKKTPHARLINIASQASLGSSPRLAVYSGTKHFVRALSEALDLEFMRNGVRVSAICPGLIDTPLLDKAGDHKGRSFREAVAQAPLISPDKVADAIFESYSGEHVHYAIGETAERQAEPHRKIAAEARARWAAMLPPRPAS